MCDNNLIINRKQPSSKIDNLKVKDKNLQQPSSLSNAINKYLCNVLTELASKLPEADRQFSTYVKRKNSTFRFAKVNEVEVYLLLDSTCIDTRKSFGYDKLVDRWHIINLSLEHGIFPDNLQIGEVIPLNNALVPHAITIAPYL